MQTITRYEAKQCEASDFGPTDKEQKLFHLWTGFSLICADIPKDESFYIVGDVSEWVSSKYEFKIDRCTNDTTIDRCHPLEDIDAMVKNYQIDTWLVNSEMDYTLMDPSPTYKVQSLIQSVHLDS